MSDEAKDPNRQDTGEPSPPWKQSDPEPAAAPEADQPVASPAEEPSTEGAADDAAAPLATEAPADVSSPPDAAPSLDVGSASLEARPEAVPLEAEKVVPLTAEELLALRRRPTYVFFGVLAAASLIADIGTKAWAEVVLSKRTALDPSITVIKDHLSFTLAYNKGGAWGLLHDASENVRRPFFLLVSALAIAFIVSLYSRLAPQQRALKWGLPLVLGGALGNLSDRITRSSVIDFIDYRADWIEKMNQFIAKYAKGWAVTDHWPTFNVADIFICIGVALMAVDMVTSRRKPAVSGTAPSAPAPAGETSSSPPAAS